MIDINLVPPHLRKKKKRKIIPTGFNIPTEVVIGFGGGLIIILILVHLLLLVTNFAKLAKHKGLQKKWEEILPAKTNVDVVLGQMRDLQSKSNAIRQITDIDQIFWAEKLNLISDNLPRGVWLRKISFADGLLTIDGSAVADQGKEMVNVHSFAANLKNSDQFLKKLGDLELGSIQRRMINTTEVVDFNLTARIK